MARQLRWSGTRGIKLALNPVPDEPPASFKSKAKRPKRLTKRHAKDRLKSRLAQLAIWEERMDRTPLSWRGWLHTYVKNLKAEIAELEDFIGGEK